EERASVVARLREVAEALGRRGHANADRVAAVDRRRHRAIFVRVEEEQLVVAAGLTDGAADRVAERLRAGLHFRVPVLLVDPTVRIPVRVGLDVVRRTAELVRAALGDRGDLQTAR